MLCAFRHRDAASLAIAKAALRKAVALLNKKLGRDGVFVGLVTVNGIVRGTAWDPDNTSDVTPELVADRFMGLYDARAGMEATI